MKNSKKGISLIVLIITIIVIIILATAILVSVINNNPISEANKARYESDRDNMQAVFTNTVGKIMAENQGVVNVTAGQINTETTGVNETTGEVAYTVDNATVAANASGTIKFDKGTNDATTYYIGKKLPIYAAGETKWYVDSEGVLSLEVAGVKYGSGEIVLTYISLGNWEHEVSNGTIESHDTESGTCSKCGENVLAAGLYAEDGSLTYTWKELIDNGKLVVTDGVLIGGLKNDTACGQGNSFDGEGILIIDNTVTSIGDKAFGCSLCYSVSSDGLVDIVIPNSVVNIGSGAFYDCDNLTLIEIPNSVETIGSFAFGSCENLTSVKIPNSVISIGNNAFENCDNLTSIKIPNSITSIEDSTFMACAKLEEIEICDSVVTIDRYSFVGCSNLTSINYVGTKEKWESTTLIDEWNYYCPEITVHCTDGDIIIPASE